MRRACSPQDLARGFLLLTDLGDTTYLAALDDATRAALYLDAIDALVRWQLASRDGELPPYDEALLRRELDAVSRLVRRAALGRTLDARSARRCEQAFALADRATTSRSRACSCIATTTRAT